MLLSSYRTSPGKNCRVEWLSQRWKKSKEGLSVLGFWSQNVLETEEVLFNGMETDPSDER